MQLLKLFATVSFLFSFLFLSSATVSQISYYGVSSSLDTAGNTKIEMIITFDQPEKKFAFDILGRIQNFEAKSFEKPIDCDLALRGITTVECNLNLTEERKTIQINYETTDFVKQLGNSYLFDADFTLNQNISRMVASVRLPEATALVTENDKPAKLSFAENATTSSDGRSIIVTWNLAEIPSDKSLKFSVFYESLTVPFWAELRIRYIIIFAVVTGLVVSFLVLRRARKSEQLVLSVLDDFEKKVMDVIMKAEGEVNQRKVVQETNLSKAKVSRVVKSLVERGIIEVQRLGRTNKLKLIKKKFKI